MGFDAASLRDSLGSHAQSEDRAEPGLRTALTYGPVPLAKWLPSGKAAHLTADDIDAIVARVALSEPSPTLDVERLARALRTMLGIDQRDDTRYDFGDLMPLARPYEAANAIAAAYLADDTEEPHDG